MSTPSLWATVVMALAAFRVFRLLSYDIILRGPRVRWVTHRAEGDGEIYVGPGKYRAKTDEFLHCPWCLGFWCCLVVWGAWLVWPGATVGASVPLAMSSIVGLVSHNLDR